MRYHEITTSKLRARGLTLDITSYQPHQKVPSHSHENAFFCMALSGVCTETYGRKERVYKPSVLSFLPAEKVHSLKFHNTGMYSFGVGIGPLLAQRVREYSLNLNTSVHCQGGQLGLLYKKAYGEFSRMDEVSPLVIEGLVLEMLAEVSRLQPDRAVERSPRWLRRAQELIRERFSEPLTLGDISDAVGVHPVHLSRVFRGHHRCTIGEYIRRLRVEYASRQLLTPQATLAEIATTLGFYDQSHFSKTFKRVMGVTPTEFRAAHRKS